ncbi:MAG: hypothetical protein JRD93_07140 [Deltaproteobacteria bacterium]|nr:hypothetical protein [Deltaproteobacteria bacterium]
MKLKVMSEIRRNVKNIFNKANFYQNALYDYIFCPNGWQYHHCPNQYVRSGYVRYHNGYLWIPADVVYPVRFNKLSRRLLYK